MKQMRLGRLDLERAISKLTTADDLICDVWDRFLWSTDEDRANPKIAAAQSLISVSASQTIRWAIGELRDLLKEREERDAATEPRRDDSDNEET